MFYLWVLFVIIPTVDQVKIVCVIAVTWVDLHV